MPKPMNVMKLATVEHGAKNFRFLIQLTKIRGSKIASMYSLRSISETYVFNAWNQKKKKEIFII